MKEYGIINSVPVTQNRRLKSLRLDLRENI